MWSLYLYHVVSRQLNLEPNQGGTMVDNLSPACRKLVDGIQDLLRYKEDAQLAEAILPELIKMLKCEFFHKLYQNIITFSNEPPGAIL